MASATRQLSSAVSGRWEYATARLARGEGGGDRLYIGEQFVAEIELDADGADPVNSLGRVLDGLGGEGWEMSGTATHAPDVLLFFKVHYRRIRASTVQLPRIVWAFTEGLGRNTKATRAAKPLVAIR